MSNFERVTRTAEHVSEGHPDKFCDQVADRILDEALYNADDEERKVIRTAVECLAKDNLLIISGEVFFPERLQSKINIHNLAQEVWERVGYGKGSELTVINHIREQSADIAGKSKTEEIALTGVDQGGAGDQGIMVGFATDENAEMMPQCYVYARDICKRIRDLRLSEDNPLGWMKSDAKSQVTLNADGQVTNVIVAIHHGAGVSQEEIRQGIITEVLEKVLPNVPREEQQTVVNGTGLFLVGGTIGDAGVVGRKIVVDAYGPHVPVGGGAYSGKDPTKVDRSAAYMARYIAKLVVAEKIGGASQCLVSISYGIGQLQPAMLTVMTDKGDATKEVSQKFPDLSPGFIIDFLKLRRPTGNPSERLPGKSGWNYIDTAAYGHYGRENFPWEQLS